ncbi:MAG: hypothetical protein ABH841_01045 [Candidatus Nealsonbacteria bacterium]
MEKILEEFIRLVDQAIEIAQKKHQELEKSKANVEMQYFMILTLRNLKKIKENAVSGQLHRPSGGATLGLSYHIGEYFDDELYDIAWEIDGYYQEKM